MQLSNFDNHNKGLQDYLIGSYLYWIKQGADAFRIDTINHVAHAFWKRIANKIRAKYSYFFMFDQSFDHYVFLAQHTLAKIEA